VEGWECGGGCWLLLQLELLLLPLSRSQLQQ